MAVLIVTATVVTMETRIGGCCRADVRVARITGHAEQRSRLNGTAGYAEARILMPSFNN